MQAGCHGRPPALLGCPPTAPSLPPQLPCLACGCPPPPLLPPPRRCTPAPSSLPAACHASARAAQTAPTRARAPGAGLRGAQAGGGAAGERGWSTAGVRPCSSTRGTHMQLAAALPGNSCVHLASAHPTAWRGGRDPRFPGPPAVPRSTRAARLHGMARRGRQRALGGMVRRPRPAALESAGQGSRAAWQAAHAHLSCPRLPNLPPTPTSVLAPEPGHAVWQPAALRIRKPLQRGCIQSQPPLLGCRHALARRRPHRCRPRRCRSSALLLALPLRYDPQRRGRVLILSNLLPDCWEACVASVGSRASDGQFKRRRAARPGGRRLGMSNHVAAAPAPALRFEAVPGLALSGSSPALPPVDLHRCPGRRRHRRRARRSHFRRRLPALPPPLCGRLLQARRDGRRQRRRPLLLSLCGGRHRAGAAPRPVAWVGTVWAGPQQGGTLIVAKRGMRMNPPCPLAGRISGPRPAAANRI